MVPAEMLLMDSNKTQAYRPLGSQQYKQVTLEASSGSNTQCSGIKITILMVIVNRLINICGRKITFVLGN